MSLRPPDYRTYLLLICMTYLWVMLLFHLDLQSNGSYTEAAQTTASQSTGSDVSIAIGVPRVHINHSFPAVVSARDRLKVQSESADEPIPMEYGYSSKGDDGDETEDDFSQIIAGKVYVFSAYLDHRPNDFDNKHNGSIVRIMAVLRIQASQPHLSCSFRQENGSVVHAPVRYYELCESHGLPYGGHILSCVVPPFVSTPPREVTVSEAGSQENWINIRVTSLRPSHDRQRFGLCVPPLFGDVATTKLVEFIELSRILGARQITFYSYQVSSNISAVLDHYGRKGAVSVVPWRYPAKLDRLSWYHGQMLAIQDCLYRNMGRVQYLAFNDLDEYLVPRVHGSWEDMLKDGLRHGECALQAQTGFFTPVAPDDELMTLVSVRRATHLSDIRTKCMVRPELVFELGIHHISKPIWANLTVAKMPTDLAFIHHYRRCFTGYGMDCRGDTEDLRLRIYGKELQRRVSEVIRIISRS